MTWRNLGGAQPELEEAQPSTTREPTVEEKYDEFSRVQKLCDGKAKIEYK